MDYARMDKRAECEISDCWIWRPSEPVTWPWEELMRGMYEERLKLKAPPYNPVEWCYKLGMNSLYGKYAQRIGGKDKAPPSHTLPIAGYVTSSCRAAVMKLMLSADKGSVISVETDGVYTTTPPDRLRGNFPLSNKLGEWSMTVYDEMIMVQNGVYLLRQGDEWKPPKSRGIPASVVKRDAILEHFEKCTGEKWPKLTFQSKESFIGLGAAVSRATFVNRRGRRSTNPFKARALHCTWADAPKEIDVEGWGSKRSHVAKACPVCRQGLNPAQAPHPLTIHSEADRWTAKPTDWISHAHTLPWEKGHEAEEWRQLAEAEGHYPNADGDVT